jgi:hypothetical protein
LRAYPDPAATLPLAILDALPEPGLLSSADRGRDQAVAGELVSAGFDAGQVSDALTALRVAVSETPRRPDVTGDMTMAITHSVRQAVRAVRANDSAAASLVTVLSERLTGLNVESTAASRTNGKARSATVTQLDSRRPRPAAVPVAAAMVSEMPAAAPMPLAVAAGGGYPPPPPSFGSAVYAAPVAQAPSHSADDYGSYEPQPSHHAPPADDVYGGYPPAPVPNQRTSRENWDRRDYPPPPPPEPAPYQPGAYEPPKYEQPKYEQPRPYDTTYQPPLSYSGDTDPHGRVAPPWQSMDLPPEPPQMRLVEHGRDGFAAPTYELVPPRPVGDLPYETLARPTSLEVDRRELGLSAGAEGDDDLLIFTSTKSAWFFNDSAPDTALDWNSGVDAGWLAAAQASAPRYERETYAGLPQREPQRNLVPGSAVDLLGPSAPLRVRRDPASIAAHASGYFGGWRRGQLQTGHSVGNRPGGWDFGRERSYR